MRKIDPKIKARDQKEFNRMFDIFEEEENYADQG